MVKKTYEAGDSWPSLAHKDLNAQAQRARSLGWTAETKESHGGFVITCPDGQCKVRFDSTPKNPARKAKEADRTIRRCSHAFEHREALQEAIEILDRSERLIQAAEQLLKAIDLEHQADVEQAETFIEQAIDHEQRARKLLLQVDGVDQSKSSMVGITENASAALKSARDVISPRYKEKPPHPEIEEVWRRYRELRGRLDEVRKHAPNSAD